MNREIKFRVYDKYRLEMVHDLNVTFTTWGEVLVEYDTGEEEGVRIQNFDLNQYTGLKDKNEIEIYEGDIVVCDHLYKDTPKFTAVIEWDEGVFGVRWKEYTTINHVRKLTAFDTEVIGNIYENPELLGEDR